MLEEGYPPDDLDALMAAARQAGARFSEALDRSAD
jgi:hypothetical protein